MIIGMSHEDLKKLRESQKGKKETRPRKRRTAVLSKKAKNQGFKKFAEMDTGNAKDNKVVVDEHVKLNDNYMRTGWYKPKKKRDG